MILKPCPLSTDRFLYDAAECQFSAAASDIGFGHGRDFERVWDDACDVGLTLVSARTGHEVVFAVEHEERDREGDLLYWELRPAKLSQQGTCSIIVFND